MPAPSKESIFETLNTKQINQPDTPSLFPELTPSKFETSDGWYYSDLHNLYGEIQFPTQPSFSAHIWQNMVMPTSSNSRRAFPQLVPTSLDFYNNHVIQITHPYTLDTHHYKHAKDFKLSRYACWCMSRNNPNMIFSRTYFISPIISPNMSFTDMNAWCYQFARVHLREQLTKHEKIINAIANKHKIDFNKFRRVNRAALFGNHSKSHIAEQNDFYIPHHTPLADHMGAATLYERANALTRAIQRINNTPKITQSTILEIIYTELNNARHIMIHNLHIDPCNDIRRTPVQKIQSILTQTERDFILKYGFQNIR